MAITTPKGEQIQFVSAKTGTHNLDTYLEAAEIGNRQLHDLLDDMFDSSTGVFKADNFQFRFDTSTDKLQVRVGQFANSTASWTDVTTFFKVTGTFSTSTSYNNFDLVTLSTKDVYIVHGLTSATTYSSESNFISSANTSKIVDVSEAKDWAIKTDGQVSSTDYSSKAWAIGGTGVTDTASKGAAKEWATKTSGTVDGSDYSAKHWATTGNVAAVSGSIGNINNVSSYLIPITNVADNITSVNTVSGSITNVNTVAGSISNVNTVAGLDTKMTSVVALESNINILGPIGSDITTVSGVSAGVVTCAILSQQIANVSNNSTNVNLVGNAISNVNTVGGAISNVNTVATNISSVNDFADKYRIGSSDPSSNNNEGDLFYNTSTNALKIYDGSAWTSGVAVGSGFLPLTGGQLTGNITFSGSQTVSGRNLSADGAKLDGIAPSANNYSHPTGNGNKHIPTDGSSGQILGYASAGTAQWQAAPSSDLVDDTSPQLGGDLATNGHDVVMGNNDLIKLGTFSGQSAAGFIYSNGSELNINSWGSTRLTGSNMTFAKAGGGEEYANFVADGATSLYHNNIKKFETTSTGVDVTGNITVSGTVDGRDIATNIPSSLGSAGQVLTVNSGASAAEWAAAGGGADLYAANESSPSAQPSATGTNAVAIGDSSTAGGNYAAAMGSFSVAGGVNAFSGLGTANGNYAVALGVSSAANSERAVALGASAITAAVKAIAIGDSSNAANTSAVAIAKSYASGTDSLAAAITNNTSSYGATGANSVSLGSYNKANGYQAGSFGGYGNVSSGNSAFTTGYQSQATGNFSVAMGMSNTASASYSAALGGQGNTASGEHSVAMGDTSTASHTNSVSIGDSVQSTATNQVNIGGTADTVRISEGYTLPTADGSANQVLTTNGSGAVSFATVSGGASASADLYLANPSSATNPTAAGANAVAIGDGADAGGAGSISIGKGSAASALESAAIGQQSTASGVSSMAAGYNSVSSAAQAISGPASLASGSNSVGFGIGTNSASYGASGTSSIAMGASSKASNSNSIAMGLNATASAGNSIAIGSRALSVNSSIALCTSYANYGNRAGGGNSICIGDGSSATRTSSVAIGYGAKSDIDGKFVYASRSFDDGNAEGSSQGGWFILVSDTTDATPEAMTTTKSSAGSSNQVVAKTDTCITFHGTVVAMQNGAQSYGSWEIKGLLVNDGGTTTVPNSAITVIHNASSWGLALSADNTNNALKIQVTGEASHNIRWVANVQTSEVTFA